MLGIDILLFLLACILFGAASVGKDSPKFHFLAGGAFMIALDLLLHAVLPLLGIGK